MTKKPDEKSNEESSSASPETAEGKSNEPQGYVIGGLYCPEVKYEFDPLDLTPEQLTEWVRAFRHKFH